ncbi:hypothetical protein CYLTODRAFT_425662, partial [Cylindrobasidium torrendii FP15055 ss-10]
MRRSPRPEGLCCSCISRMGSEGRSSVSQADTRREGYAEDYDAERTGRFNSSDK